ncbi:hypothetical protein FRC03_007350 [Tulasnella sp. 419]|nr:hypothetical protein FRC03_007350 [Tulasnella sp. 419]
MPSKFTSLLVAAGAVGYAVSPVFADPASAFEINVVKEQFKAALLTPTVVPEFNPIGLLELSFPATGDIDVGEAVTKENSGAMPTVQIEGTLEALTTSTSPLNSTATKYTFMLIDGDYPGADISKGVNAHYLQNDITYGTLDDGAITFNYDSTPVIAYAGPGPASGSGPHRYTFLAFAQPAGFAAPATPAPGGSVQLISYPEYVKSANLGSPIAGTFFTVQVGESTVSMSATGAVDTATIPQPSSAASTGAGASSASRSGSSAAAAATQSTSPNGASKMTVSGLVGGIAAIFAAAMFI